MNPNIHKLWGNINSSDHPDLNQVYESYKKAKEQQRVFYRKNLATKKFVIRVQ